MERFSRLLGRIGLVCMAGICLYGSIASAQSVDSGVEYRSALRRAAAELAPSKVSVAVPGSIRRECKVRFETSIDAFDVATYFSWYRSRDQFQCMSVQPVEGYFRSADRQRIRAHMRRLVSHGFDGIAGVIYADPEGEGRESREMRWMLRALRELPHWGLQFMPLYDFSIATHLSAKLCNTGAGKCPPGFTPLTEFNFDRYPILQESVVENLVMIAERFVLPFADLERPGSGTIRFLQRTDGTVILDELGLPRPEIYIYIPRVWTDDNDFATVRRVVERVTEEFQARGLGRPAFTLDIIYFGRERFNEGLVAAFGDTAVRLTSFFAVDHRAGDLGELARMQRKMYRRAASKLRRAINQGRLHRELQIGTGAAVNFDKRAWGLCYADGPGPAWPAGEASDWVESFRTLIGAAAHGECRSEAADESPVQNLRMVYAGEGYESTWLCAEWAGDGAEYPHRYGCEPLWGFAELMRQLGELP